MKKIISTPSAPGAIGPYNQGVVFNGLLYASGQIAIDPETGTILSGDIAAETDRVMKNLKAILAAAGMNFENVVKTSIFIADMNDFAAINKVYGSYFDEATAPARETVEVACLPKNVNVEISMIAVK